MENLVVKEEKENFIEKLAKDDPEYTKVLRSIIDKKTEKAATKKEISEITKDILASDAVKFEDNTSITFAEVMVAGVIANTIKNPNTSFKELSDMQKVIGESAEADRGVVINVITNGQDLGE